MNTRENEKIIFQIKSAHCAGRYLFFNSTIHLCAILGLISLFIIMAVISATTSLIPHSHWHIQEAILTGTYNMGLAGSQSPILPKDYIYAYGVFYLVLAGLLSSFIPLFFSIAKLKKRTVFITDSRCYIDSPTNKAQINFSRIESVTLSQTSLDRRLNIASISILDTNALKKDTAILAIHQLPINSLFLPALNKKDAEDILAFFKEKGFKTFIENEKLLEDSFYNSLKYIWTKKDRDQK